MHIEYYESSAVVSYENLNLIYHTRAFLMCIKLIKVFKDKKN